MIKIPLSFFFFIFLFVESSFAADFFEPKLQDVQVSSQKLLSTSTINKETEAKARAEKAKIRAEEARVRLEEAKAKVEALESKKADQAKKNSSESLLETEDQKKTSGKSVFLGHLLSPTTYTPKKNTYTLGSHIMGYSPSDNLLVGTSSFLLLFYNSPNIYIKYAKQKSKRQRWATQLIYLKSDLRAEFFSTGYFMETIMGWFMWSYDVTSFYTVHANVNYMYFFNEGRPHSFRREPFNNDAFQISFSTLHDIKISEKYSLASEIGVLGASYRMPNLHGAVSFRYTGKNYFIQAGYSFDSHILEGSFDRNDYIENNQTLGPDHTNGFVTHPEVAFHYFF